MTKSELLRLDGHAMIAGLQASKGQVQRGRLPAVSLIFAFVTCYGTLALVAILSVFGVALRINDMLWGAIITVASAISWLALARNASRHGRITPALLGFLGLCAIAWTMMIRYRFGLEIAGFGGLLGGVLWDRQCCLRRGERTDEQKRPDESL